MQGIDIVEVRRIQKIVEKHPEFLQKVFNDEEIERIKKRKNPYERIAGMYAAKEAVSKAMTTGIGKFLSFHDIKLKYDGEVPRAEVGEKNFRLTISHEKNYAIAFAEYVEDEVKIEREIIGKIKMRSPNTHKGDYGKIAIIAGSLGMTGSAYLSSNAALKMGAGLVYNIVPREIMDIMSIKYIEPIVKSFDELDELEEFLKGIDTIAIGPGMGTGEEAVEKLKLALKFKDKKIVVDADGLNILSKDLELLKVRDEFTTVLTPHEGEFARLCKRSVEEVREGRIEFAKEFARKNRVVLLLKGHETIITDGERVEINKTGNAGMATAGSGDVLTGIIATLLKTQDAFDAARVGAYIHGLSGDIYAKKNSMTTLRARDLIEGLDEVFRETQKL
ncbi:NAD(P)H-hydrate dehydratase [Peptoniphilus sp.]|jgi:ADP-dependent NAD(P)H-hydrate dehydratase|uniref:NAD(P)H-hydrate dehydratase n=1 Tax=Peptoniphilus sp. TaxID=1971214 RepID=UPI003D8A449A